MLGLLTFSAVAAAQDAPALKTDKEKLSYAMGFDLGTQLGKQLIEIDTAVFARALNDSLSGKTGLMSGTEIQAAISKLQSELKKRQYQTRTGNELSKEEIEKMAQFNKAAGERFLAENGKKEGVTTLPSGLQYKVLRQGSGKMPGPEDSIVCKYSGRLINGMEFFNSYKSGQEMMFSLKNGVIKGWAEALLRMPVGSKWQLFVPSQLAYGEAGSGPIGPNAAVIYEIELLGVK